MFALKLILADGMGRIVFKNLNRALLIPEPIPYNFMYKPVTERIPRV
jgi:hypothetical protein